MHNVDRAVLRISCGSGLAALVCYASALPMPDEAPTTRATRACDNWAPPFAVCVEDVFVWFMPFSSGARRGSAPCGLLMTACCRWRRGGAGHLG